MSLDISYAPELAQLALSPVSAPARPRRCRGAAGMTPGRLAGLISAALADPARWWYLAKFDPQRPVHLRLEAPPWYELWLTTTPPGHRGAPGVIASGSEGTRCRLLAAVSGELTVRATTVGGTQVPLLPGRIRVLGEGDAYELANLGTSYAVSLCAHAAESSDA